MISNLEKDILKLKNPKRAKTLSGFFKNNNNIFYGIYAKDLKDLSKKYFSDLSLKEIKELLKSNIQEKKQLACYTLVFKCKENKEKVFNFYLKNLKYFDDWGLIDSTCISILGDYLKDKNKDILYTLSKSSKWNEQRISIVSCFAFIRQNDFKDILKISEILIENENDLIQKAIGWMLREVGKKDKEILLNFLNKNIKKIQRISLRYALEKFPKKERDYWYAQ